MDKARWKFVLPVFALIRWFDFGQRAGHARMDVANGGFVAFGVLLQQDVSRDFLRFHLDQVQVGGRVHADLQGAGQPCVEGRQRLWRSSTEPP